MFIDSACDGVVNRYVRGTICEHLIWCDQDSKYHQTGYCLDGWFFDYPGQRCTDDPAVCHLSEDSEIEQHNVDQNVI